MEHIVKAAREYGAQQRRYREWQDKLLTAIGLSRADFPCFEGIVVEDENILVWAHDEANFARRPRNLLSATYNADTDHWEYQFMARDEEFVGEPVVVSA